MPPNRESSTDYESPDSLCTISKKNMTEQPRPGSNVNTPALLANSRAAADPDYALAVRLKAGDLLAFEELVAKYEQPIVNFAARFLRDTDEARDVAQTAFLHAHGALANFRFASRLSSWLYAIARNLCRNELRRRSRCPLTYMDEESQRALTSRLEDSQIRTACEHLFQAELIQTIEQAMAALPNPQRTAILLLCQFQICYQEIAAILQISVPATKSLIHRARLSLRRQLAPYLAGPRRWAITES
jgi:RNA polymerase sigma-70 factor (ECF subfamily)